MSNHTKPSGQPGGKPSGTPTPLRDNDDAPTRRSLMREYESAVLLAEAGYLVEQNPSVPGSKKPDYKIEGKIFDCYAPTTKNAYNIVDTIREKVAGGQSDRIVLNLDDTQVSPDALLEELNSIPIPKLQEIIIVSNGSIIEFFPFDD
jgi:Contact-dependent growth inhibition CdiA C-terminal domain